MYLKAFGFGFGAWVLEFGVRDWGVGLGLGFRVGERLNHVPLKLIPSPKVSGVVIWALNLGPCLL